ncbi:Lysophosphatidic acid phosphatase type 6-like [Scleropages formosus]|uniref:Lysophosphatidic acid phosphatase type 6-like n=1 Tax=Scleropages formosus TaxID=113540 RepID=A0A0P7V7Q7_SCLFO|nr:Lysophosphatidic acid phosphatase type 6-like [Scleropages formosus]
MSWPQKKAELVEKRDSGSISKSADYELELQLVQVAFRHGARTPLRSIPAVQEAQWVPDLLKVPDHTRIEHLVMDLQGGPRPPAPIEDNYRSSTLSGGSHPGQLTTLGMQQLYDLGQRLRKSYVVDVPFLMSAFSSAEVYVRSTNIVRTIESARCLVAGLFQQKQEDEVPIFTTDIENEVLYPNYHTCNLLKLLIGQRWAESSQLPDLAADLKSIQSALGIPEGQRVDFILIRDDMVAREAHGLHCPEPLSSWRATVEKRAVQMICHIYGSNNRGHLQLSVGPFLHILLTNIEDKIQGVASSCSRWPPYAADLTLELYQHRSTKEAFIKVSYLGQDQLIPGCSDVYCPLEEFKEALSAFTLTVDHYHSLCSQDDL